MELTLDLSYLNEISGGDQEFIHDILNTFLEEMPKDMATLQAAIEDQNILLIGKVAHKTKSTLHTVGLNELKDLALKIEQGSKSEASAGNIIPWSTKFIHFMEQVYPRVEELLEV